MCQETAIEGVKVETAGCDGDDFHFALLHLCYICDNDRPRHLTRAGTIQPENLLISRHLVLKVCALNRPHCLGSSRRPPLVSSFLFVFTVVVLTPKTAFVSIPVKMTFEMVVLAAGEFRSVPAYAQLACRRCRTSPSPLELVQRRHY